MSLRLDNEGTQSFLAGGGDMGRLMRIQDWSGSPLGWPETWPQSLRSVVGLLLNSKFPMFIAWGAELGCLYNDPYAEVLGTKHPQALGAPFRDIWGEIWPDISPLIAAAMAGEAIYRENQPLVMNRNGFDERTWFTFSYSPVHDESGQVTGLFCACTETTSQVLAERDLREGEARFRALVNASSEVVYRMSPDWTEMRQLDGRGFIIDTEAPSVKWVDQYLFPEDRPHILAVIDETIRTKGVFELEHRMRRLDGSVGWTASRAVPVLDATGEIVEWFGMAGDVTARRRAEERRDIQNRLLELAVTDVPLRQALDGLLRVLEATTVTDMLGSVLLLDDDGLRLRFGAGPSLPAAYKDAIDDLVIGPTVGLCGTAAYTRDSVYVADVSIDPLWSDFRAVALAHGLRACWSTPILSGSGDVLGAFMMYHREPCEPVAEDLETIEFVARSAALVIERKRAEERLRNSEARLSFLDRLGAETAAFSDADAVLATTTRLLGEHLNLSVCAYADMDEDQDGFTIRGDWAAPGSKTIVGHYSLADFGRLAVKNLSAGLPLVVNDNLRELAPEEAATFQNIGIAATICMPLVKDGRLAALMAVHDRAPRIWTRAELDLLREVTARSWAHVERVAATAELRASEARFRLMADAVPQIVWITDAQGRVEFFNKQWADYIGVPDVPPTAGDVAGTYVHPEDKARTMTAFEEARRMGGVFEVEHRIRRKDGIYRWFLVRAEPYRDSAMGEVVRWFGASVDIHDRRLAEVALRESEVRLRGVLDGMSESFTLLDRDFRIVDMNPEALRMEGRPAAEVIGKTHWEAHPQADPALGELYRRAMADRTPATYEHRYAWPDGRVTWLSVRVYPVPDGLATFYGDVTDRKEAEAALRASEERFRTALTIETVGAIYFDMEGTLTDANDAFLRMSGHTRAELEAGQLTWQNLTPTEWLADSERAFAELKERGVTTPYEKEYVHKDGSRWWALFAAKLLPDGTGFEFVVDITDRKVAEAGLRELNDTLERRVMDAVAERTREQERSIAAEAARRQADALYRAYFENTPEALFVIGIKPDGSFVVEEVNPAHEAGVGLKLDDIRGKCIEEILPASVAQRVLETYRHVVATGDIHQYREEFDLSGEPQHWDTSLVPMWDEHGDIVRLIGSSRNVTRQVIAEEALRQSQKMEAMGQLTGGVAHDFNNLLTPIVGALDMLQRRGLGGEREQRLIDGAIQSAERAKALVQRLLAFARRQPLRAVAVDVAQLVSGMADLIASTTGPQIKVVVDVDRDLPLAKADPNQLEMAVLNLAVNARDAMPEGGTLRISAEAATVGRQHRSGLKPGRYLQLSVADTGIGMDETTLSRAVEPFFSTKGVGKGTGLGLSMVHGLASQLGGAVTIRSTPGMGTNVELWLPQGEEVAIPAEVVQEEQVSRVGPGTVLLIDDEDLVRLSTADMLIELGYKVVEASSAEEALRLMNRGLNPDVVVTDHLMPGMSGTDLARVLQREWPLIKVLVVSGYAETSGIAPDLPRLTKPFRNVELATSLSALI